MVTLLTSSRLVTPSLTFCSPERRRFPDAILGRLVADVEGTAARHDDAPDGFGNRHDLVQPHASLVAIGALAAAYGLIYADTFFDVRVLETFLFQGLSGDFPRIVYSCCTACAPDVGR